MHAQLWTAGACDGLLILESDNEQKVLGALAQLASLGNVRTQSLRAFDAADRIARLNPDGTLDIAFDPNANGTVYSIALQPDGKILAGGDFTFIGGQRRNRIARLDATTGLPDSFNPNANLGIYSIAVQADGKILAGGFSTERTASADRHAISSPRIDATTGLADSFDPNANNPVNSIAVQADGKILAGAGSVRQGVRASQCPG